ncbi:MAG: hypothetical protein QM648_03765 [Solirubrobacterales bacterium]
MIPNAPLAHEMWFDHTKFPYDFGFLTQTATLTLLFGALLLTFLLRFVNHFWDGIDVPPVAAIAPWVAFAVRIHLAMSMLGLLSLGVFLSPAMDLRWNAVGVILGIVMLIVAISMAAGYRSREAAWLLIASGPLAMAEFGIAPVLQRVDLLGLAGFIIVAGAGRWSADVERGASEDPFFGPARLRPEGVARLGLAVLLFRVAAGLALIIVAGYEKLFNPELALDFLHRYPNLQLADLLGLPLSDIQFIRTAGAVEVLFGLLLISGALPQVIILIAGVPFTATLFVFGINELVGHLPVYAAMFTIFVFGCHPQLRPAAYAWPWQLRRLAAQPPST